MSNSTLPRIIEGYDLDLESARLGSIADVVVRGQSLNRGNAVVRIDGAMDSPRHAAARARHRAAIFPTTVDEDAPVLELGWPLSGPFVRCSAGVYMDLYLGVAQKLLDPSHPRIRASIQVLADLGMLTRREINTDDYLVAAEGVEGLHLPQDVADHAASLTAKSFPGSGSWKAFLSNSGTEAIEAALKIAWQVRYKRFVETHGHDTLARVAADLGIGALPEMDRDRGRPETVLADYPFFMVGCWGGFHGRTLGSLHFTTSKKAQRIGYPQTRWTRRIPYNGSVSDLEALLDGRPLAEILASPGGVRGVIESGRIPRDLFAGFLAEPFQGEGGYRAADAAWFQGIAEVVARHGGLFCVDEVQTVGRTGTLFFSEQLGVQPDVVATAKGVIVGITLARADLARYLHQGWHANTWGGGKIFDNQFAGAVLDTLVNHRDPVLGGLSYFENTRIKSAYLRAGLEALRAKHPDLLHDVDLRGFLVGLSVKRREEIVRIGWKRGLKLLGCGPSGEVARLRLIFLVDTLAREVDEVLRVLDQVFTEVGTPSR